MVFYSQYIKAHNFVALFGFLCNIPPMRTNTKRVSVMIGEEQYEEIARRGLNLSGFIRDLIGDHFSEHVIQIRVSPQTYELYSEIIANTGATDEDIEPLLEEVFKKLLDVRLKKIASLRKKLKS